MNQLYTEYLIDIAVQERIDQAVRLEKAREARAAGVAPDRGEGFRQVLRHLRFRRFTPATTPLATTANDARRAIPC